MVTHFADRLTEAVRRRKNSLCVGLDPRWDALPLNLRTLFADGTLAGVARAYEAFCCRVIDLVAPHVAIVKPQAAFFEASGPPGLASLQHVLRHAHAAGLLTILDGKRNDIASTAEAYADAAFAGVRIEGELHPVWDADSLTINPYLGRDAVEPFLQSARRTTRGLFVLVRTSNPGSGQFQDLECRGRPLYQHVGAAVRSWAQENLGACGLGDVGAVVGATHPAELTLLRQQMPEVWFLIPGYGAQGGGASEVAGGFRADGLGAVVNSSRGIIACFRPEDPDWEARVVQATQHAANDLATSTPMQLLT